MAKNYPMWNEWKTGVLTVVDGNLTFVEPEDPRYAEILAGGVNVYQPDPEDVSEGTNDEA